MNVRIFQPLEVGIFQHIKMMKFDTKNGWIRAGSLILILQPLSDEFSMYRKNEIPPIKNDWICEIING